MIFQNNHKNGSRPKYFNKSNNTSNTSPPQYIDPYNYINPFYNTHEGPHRIDIQEQNIEDAEVEQ